MSGGERNYSKILWAIKYDKHQSGPNETLKKAHHWKLLPITTAVASLHVSVYYIMAISSMSLFAMYSE